ncbi:hypothetical protein BSKO_00176 [Bryopsis sp. KO-2023]|nr:hypothetical protein BSKO_00176 [Bryopsis sp. KO-2023]
MDTSHWSRGCGTGIGLSHHKNEFSLGVTIGNWVEDHQGFKDKQTGKHIFGSRGPFESSTTQRTSFTPDEKYGSELLQSTSKDAVGKCGECVGQKCMFPHGDLYEQPIECHATLHQLAFKDTATIGETPQRVQDFLWNGQKLNDSKVPLNSKTFSRGTQKRQEWESQEDNDPFATTYMKASLEVAVHAAGVDTRATPAREKGTR